MDDELDAVVLGRAAHATLTLLFARTLDAFKMAFTARKKVRSLATSRASRARREPVAGSVDGDSAFRHRDLACRCQVFSALLIRASTLERDHAGC